MTKDTIQKYTMRISSANKSDIIVCVYEIAEIYLEDAIKCHETEDVEGFKNSCIKASRCINDLYTALDFDYELAIPLMKIYLFMDKELNLASVKGDVNTVTRIQAMITKLKLAFEEIAKSDTSGSVMGNVEKVYSGLTYGKNRLNENVSLDTNRGFTV
ncbi:MAG: flagellar protein FliS [Lachnospiraceae bacterium]|nr:flagellar protein FliS [Lachnospiraceae bacterium]